MIVEYVHIMPSESGAKLEERKIFYVNGQPWEHKFYRNGKLEGEYKYWRANGQLWEREFYRDGKQEGESKRWRNGGRPWEQSFHRDGKREGEHKYWHEDGQLLEPKFYRDGTLIDSFFNQTKKKVFLRMKRNFRNRANLFDSIMIFDLTKIACL